MKAGVTYSMRGDKVLIDGPLFRGFEVSESQVQRCIRNVRRNRPIYRTEAAWRKEVALYEGALEYLRQHKTQREEG